MPGAFEFTEKHNEALADLHRWLRWFSVTVIAVGALSIATAVIQLVGDTDQGGTWGAGWVLRGLLGVVFGLLWMRPLKSIAGIIQTSNHDIPQLIQALRHVNRAMFWGVMITLIQVAITAGGGIGGWILENR